MMMAFYKKKPKDKKLSPTLDYMKKMREDEWKIIQAEEKGFKKLEGKNER